MNQIESYKNNLLVFHTESYAINSGFINDNNIDLKEDEKLQKLVNKKVDSLEKRAATHGYDQVFLIDFKQLNAILHRASNVIREYVKNWDKTIRKTKKLAEISAESFGLPETIENETFLMVNKV